MDGHASPRNAPLPGWVPRLPISVDDYYRMAEAGMFPHERRVELIEGELIAMSPMGVRDAHRIMRINHLLVPALGDRAVLAPQVTARMGDFSAPEPDFMLVRPSYLQDAKSVPQPGDMLLVIEVSDSTLRYDRTVKARRYARHGVPEYWIVDVRDNAVIVHREPKDETYAVVRQAAPGDVLEPALLPGLRVAVADILA